MRKIYIDTADLHGHDADVFWLVLTIGDKQLQELDFEVVVRCDRMVTCYDGQVFDHTSWPGDIHLGLGRGGLQFAIGNAETFAGTMADYLAGSQGGG